MNRICLPAWLIVVLLSVHAFALDYRDARQTAGIYVSTNGRMHSLFGDFTALRYVEGEAQEVQFTLSSDLELWVEGHRVPTGRKVWTFRVDAEGAWTIGDADPDEGGTRFGIPHGESSTCTPCLTSSFHLDPEANAVVLQFSYGNRTGHLLFCLERGVGRSSAAIATLDLIRGRRQLARMREIAGLLEAERAKRPAWSGILADLGTAMVKAGDDVHLTAMTFEVGEKEITMTATGQAGGGQAAADAVAAALRVGNGPRIFSEVSRPVARLADEGETWNFEVIATAPISKWNSVAPVEALSDGREASAVALELLLLESRLTELTATAPLSVADIQPRVLSAKRSAGVMLSHVEALDRKEDHGLLRIPVRLRVSGGGEEVIAFIRSLEDCSAPLTIVPERMTAALRSCELDLTVVFYDYVPLATREPAMNGLIAPLKQRPGFREKVDLYLQGAGAGAPRAFVPPAWARDPFASAGE